MMLSKFKSSNADSNYISYGEKTGKFKIDSNKLYKLLKKGKHDYAIIDKRTQFFMFYLDIDLKDADIKKYNMSIDNKSIKACKYIHKLLVKHEPSLKDRYKFLCKDLIT